MSVVVNILAAIGLIFIISTLIYYIYKYIKNRVTKRYIAMQNPPGSYMQSSGIKCPDYWVNVGIDTNGNYICKNSFNIATTTATGCNADTITFPPVTTGKTWDYNNPNGLTSLSDSEKYSFLTTKKYGNENTRCDWINKCGPNTQTQGIWSGVNEICNAPPPS